LECYLIEYDDVIDVGAKFVTKSYHF